jgi:hypothetical protein
LTGTRRDDGDGRARPPRPAGPPFPPGNVAAARSGFWASPILGPDDRAEVAAIAARVQEAVPVCQPSFETRIQPLAVPSSATVSGPAARGSVEADPVGLDPVTVASLPAREDAGAPLRVYDRIFNRLRTDDAVPDALSAASGLSE